MSTRFRNPGLLRHWTDYVEACLRTGRVQEAQATHRMLERRLDRAHDPLGTLAQARIAAMVSPDESAVERFTHATKLFGAQDSSYELGRTLLAYANRLSAIGPRRRQPAGAHLGDVHVPARRRRHLDRPGPEAGRRHAPPANPLDRLTAEERDIAQRVCDGQRNREIAGSLHLSIRTIELRLTRIYRSLGVHSRAELIAVVNEIRSPNAGAEIARRVGLLHAPSDVDRSARRSARRHT